MPKVFGQPLQEPSEGAVALPLLKATMTGLVGWISVGQVVPGSARAQHPKNSVQHGPRITPRPSSAGFGWLRLQQRFQNRPLGIGEVHAPI